MIDADAALARNNDVSSDVISIIDADAALTQSDDDSNKETTGINSASYDGNYIGTRATKYVCFNISTTAGIEQLFSSLQHSHSMPTTVDCSVKLLSKHILTTYNDRVPPLRLCLHNLPHVRTLQSVAGEGTACGITDISFDESSVRFMEASSCDANMAHMVYSLQTRSMMDEECFSKRSTCRQRKNFKIWTDWWDDAFDAQLGAHRKADCIGIPISRSTIMSYHQSLSPFCMHSVIEFQTVPKLELGECVTAHAYNLRGLHAINSSMWPY